LFAHHCFVVLATGTPRKPPEMLDEGSMKEGSAAEIVDTIIESDGEDAVIHALGIKTQKQNRKVTVVEEEESYNIIPNPDADIVDLSDMRGTRAPTMGQEHLGTYLFLCEVYAHLSMNACIDKSISISLVTMAQDEPNDDLDALAELVPELKARNRCSSTEARTMTMHEPVVNQNDDDEGEEVGVEVEVEVSESHEEEEDSPIRSASPNPMVPSQYMTRPAEIKADEAAGLQQIDSMQVQQSEKEDDGKVDSEAELSVADIAGAAAAAKTEGASLPSTDKNRETFDNDDQNLGGFDDADSEHALNSNDSDRGGDNIKDVHAKKTPEKISSCASLSTATQTHEVRMPMYLPTFKPATGCTNASDFIVRCFVARLRSGITVVKHGRSRWAKSRLRILHIHPDGRSLSWKSAVGEPNSSRRPPKLDLSTCKEVRHAWSPDPLNPMFTGTLILRQKCEAANAHKSFALIFPKRTVDITAVTADQCKVLMEGFSALCFRLQVANLAGRGSKKDHDEEEVATTASVTLTNNSTQLSPSGSGIGARSKRTPAAKK
jgi:hypothetical protein